MKCKFCDAELEADNLICPGCGAENATQEPVAEMMAEEETPVVMEEAEVTEETAEEIAEEVTEEANEETVLFEAGKDKNPGGLKGGKLVLVIATCCIVFTALVLAVLWGAGLLGGSAVKDPADAPTGQLENATLVDTYTVTDEAAMAAADKVIATMGELQLNNAQLQIYYWTQVFDFLNNNGTYYFDYTQPLSEQYYSEEEQVTWEQYFVDIAIESWHRYGALYLLGKESGFELSQAQKDELAALPAQLEGMLETYGVADTDALIRQDFGAASNAQAYYDYMAIYLECLEFFNDEYAKIQPTAEEVEAFFDEHAAEFEDMGITKDAQVVDVRHILIKPETNGLDENTKPISTEEDIENCRIAAQALLDQWLAGEATEDSFAALVKDNTADPGSADNGGLYEKVEKGRMVEEFDAWIFDPERKSGDYGLVKTDFGYHIMYFVKSQPSDAWYNAAETNIMAEKANQLIEDAKEKWPVDITYEDIVLGHIDLAQ